MALIVTCLERKGAMRKLAHRMGDLSLGSFSTVPQVGQIAKLSQAR